MLSMTSADAAVAEDAAQLTSTSSSSGSIVGILHASGVLADATLRNQTLQGLRTSWAPKEAALQQLGGALARQPGAFQLLFSSIAALLGSPGQANYSAANSTLDVMAQASQAEVGSCLLNQCMPDRSQSLHVMNTVCSCLLLTDSSTPCTPSCLQGLAAVSVQWGAWAGAGMAGHDSSTRARVERTGLGLVESEAGLAALEGLLLQAAAASPAQAAAVPIRWPKFLQQQFKGTPPVMFAAFADLAAPAAAAKAPVAVTVASSRSGRQQKQRTASSSSRPAAAKSSVEHEAFMLVHVQEAVAAVLGRADIDAQEPLMAAGLDSLSSVELRNSLEGKLGLELPSTLVFDYPTMAALAGFLASKIQPGGAGAELAAAVDSASDSESYSSEASYSWDEEDAGLPASLALPRQRARQLVAVTGMVVRAAGDALAGMQPVDAVQMVPASRWNLEAHAGEAY